MEAGDTDQEDSDDGSMPELCSLADSEDDERGNRQPRAVLQSSGEEDSDEEFLEMLGQTAHQSGALRCLRQRVHPDTDSEMDRSPTDHDVGESEDGSESDGGSAQ